MTHPDGSPVSPLPDLLFAEVDARALGLEGPRLSYMEAGQGARTVLLLHGIGANSTGWRFVLHALAPDARVIAWNAPGYFLSDGFVSEAPRAEAYADAAAALLDTLGVRGPVLLVGSSFGSMVAACLAARHPARVDRMVLLGTSRGLRWTGPEGRARMLAMRSASVAEGGVALARTRYGKLIAPGSAPLVVELVQRMLAATNPRGLMQAARCMDGVDVVEDFAPRVACPTLAITCAEDVVNPPEVGRAVADAIPGARFESPPGVGHLPELEAPALTAEMIRAHLFGG